MKNYIYILAVLISFLVVGFFFGKGCKPKPETVTVTVQNDSLFEIIHKGYKSQINILEAQISDLKGRKAEKVTIYQTKWKTPPKSGKDSLKWCLGNWDNCNEILIISDSIIEKQNDQIGDLTKLVRLDSIQNKICINKLTECKTDLFKNEVILKGVQKNYGRELKRKKTWRKIGISVIAALTGVTYLIIK